MTNGIAATIFSGMTFHTKLATAILYYLGALTTGYALGQLISEHWYPGGWLLLVGVIALYISRDYLRRDFWI